MCVKLSQSTLCERARNLCKEFVFSYFLHCVNEVKAVATVHTAGHGC